MTLKERIIKPHLLLFSFLFVFASYHPAFATESRTNTKTLQTQTIFTNNSNCRGNEGEHCLGGIQQGGISIGINGGTLNFNLCNTGINRVPTDDPCRVTPAMIPPGADNQLGTGLDPISFNDNGSVALFGGLTNDPLPTGSSDVVIPGFLIHGPSPGETTLNCLSEAACGQTTSRITLRAFQNFRSVPNGVAITPGGALCTAVRCNHIEFTMDQQQFGVEAAQTPFKIDFVIDSTTDIAGQLIPGTGNGSFVVTCTGSCVSGSGTFSVLEPLGGFSPASTGFVRIDSQTMAGCTTGTLVDPFHQNGVSCRAGP